ncbi:MAG: VCBS repeat-containing protein [Deinococcaceae bacterium]
MSRMVSLTILSSLLLASCQMRTAPVAAPIDTPDMNTPVNESGVMQSVVLPLGMDEEGVAALANQLTQTTGLVVTPVTGSTAIIDSQGKTYITSRFRITRSNATATTDLRNLTFVLASRSQNDDKDLTKLKTIENTSIAAIYQRIGTRDVQITDAALLKKIARTVKPTGGQMYGSGVVSADDSRRITTFRAPVLDTRYRASFQGFSSSDFASVGELPPYTNLIPAGFLAQPVAGSTSGSRTVSSGVELTVSVYFPTPTDARGQAIKVTRVDLNGVLLKNDKAVATESLEHQALFDSGAALRQHIADTYAPSTNLQPITVLNLLPGSSFASMPLSSVKSILGDRLSEVRNICSINLSTEMDAAQRVYLVGSATVSQDPTVKSDLKTFFKTTDPLKLSMGCADDGSNLAKRFLIHGGQTGQRLDANSSMVYNKGAYKTAAATATTPIEASYTPNTASPAFGWKPGERVMFTFLDPSQSSGMLQGEFRVATAAAQGKFSERTQPAPEAPGTGSSGTSQTMTFPITIETELDTLPSNTTRDLIVITKGVSAGITVTATNGNKAPVVTEIPSLNPDKILAKANTGGLGTFPYTCLLISDGNNSRIIIYDRGNMDNPVSKDINIGSIDNILDVTGNFLYDNNCVITVKSGSNTKTVTVDPSGEILDSQKLPPMTNAVQLVGTTMYISNPGGLQKMVGTPTAAPMSLMGSMSTGPMVLKFGNPEPVITRISIQSFAINGDMAMIQTPTGLEIRRYPNPSEPAIKRWIVSSQSISSQSISSQSINSQDIRIRATATGFAAYNPNNNALKTVAVSTLMNTTGFTSLGGATPVVTETNTRPGFGGNSIVMGDIDGDGDLDVITDSIPPQDNVEYKPQLIFQINDGEGMFGLGPTTVVEGISTVDEVAPIDLKIGTTKAALGLVDLNGDGKLDLISANEGANEVQVFTNTTSNEKADFTLAQTLTLGISGPQAVVSGDFNRDGKMDFAVANKGNKTLSVFMNNGNMNFAQTNLSQAATAGAPVRLAVGDMDGDGRLEVVSANDNATLSIFKPLGGAVQTLGAGNIPSAVAVGDLNGDGRLDIVVSLPETGKVFVLARNADNSGYSPSSISTGTGTQPVDVDLGDFDGDGTLDIMTANEGMGEAPGTLGLLKNTTMNNMLSFADVTIVESLVAGKGKALAIGSLNHTAAMPNQTLDAVFLINNEQDGARVVPELGQ